MDDGDGDGIADPFDLCEGYDDAIDVDSDQVPDDCDDLIDNDGDGVSGDSVYSYINEGEGDASLFFLPGQVSLLANATYHDFTLGSAIAAANQPALIEITAIVIDFYGNAVVDANSRNS